MSGVGLVAVVGSDRQRQRQEEEEEEEKERNKRGSYWNKMKWGGKLPNKSSKFHLLFKQYQVWSFDQLYLI